MWTEFKNLEKLDLSRSKSDLIPSHTCKDGFKISIQGHYGAYSKPREECSNIYQYESMEIKTSEQVESLKKYQDGEDSTIYGYVPLELIEALIVEHGGFND